MRRYVLVDKPIGLTPLEVINQWKKTHPKYQTVAASYAGRLDPMASGKLLILLGKECHRQKQYTNLDKVYDIEVLLDIASDTGDVLGIVTGTDTVTAPSDAAIRAVITEEVGTHSRPYPVYSSKPVAGKPLFLHALEGTLDTIQIPVHDETIYRIKFRGAYTLSSANLRALITSLLARAPKSDEPSKKLGADFRIDAVRKSWGGVFNHSRTYHVLRLRVSCGSGTYMRTLAEHIGASLGTSALALSIHRRSIGRHFFGPFFLPRLP